MKKLLVLAGLAIICVVAGLAAPIVAQENVFTHEYLALKLPEGWVAQDIPSNFEKEVIGWLKSDKIAGASITVHCYRGRRYNYSSVRIGALRTLAAAYPKGQEMLKDKTKIKTDSGGTAVVELWRGAVDAGGQTVLLQSPLGIVRTKQCWLLMIGYAPDASVPQLEEDSLKIIKSAQ
jgi:hypothetical protein